MRNDPDHLLNEQYRNSGNLDARFEIHERFSTNPYGWHRWVFDQLNLDEHARVLELGCGPAYLWTKNSWRMPQGSAIALTDFSAGMLDDARNALAEDQDHFSFHQMDAQELNFDNGSFDAVIANHMLYHVPDRSAVFAHVRRVLADNGTFFATTNGNSVPTLGTPHLLKRKSTAP
jgi:ubiquinone/menaquinone biosynthesis C-methylase UbiE